jgi:hypothetical protein
MCNAAAAFLFRSILRQPFLNETSLALYTFLGKAWFSPFSFQCLVVGLPRTLGKEGGLFESRIILSNVFKCFAKGK